MINVTLILCNQVAIAICCEAKKPARSSKNTNVGTIEGMEEGLSRFNVLDRSRILKCFSGVRLYDSIIVGCKLDRQTTIKSVV